MEMEEVEYVKIRSNRNKVKKKIRKMKRNRIFLVLGFILNVMFFVVYGGRRRYSRRGSGNFLFSRVLV